ncbi:unnamed protein product [Vitrella brassicaformis CCMP3155]|uniref:Protein kinase domain-containing protein n=2 Tax=Vitrella brassicaformis TaxID=1169539 RepID=A0A0G4E8Z8_VITBC|nr:unnamed protein product [Vitrella brassicaformis CCMP3155]|eukprot:CEL92380.1 unnamed protein product [Vitrella brassicaformis CCMP3155]
MMRPTAAERGSGRGGRRWCWRRLIRRGQARAELLKSYRLGKKLAEGGFSRSYTATPKTPSRCGMTTQKVVVKVIKIDENAEQKRERWDTNRCLRFMKGRRHIVSAMTPDEIDQELKLLHLAQHGQNGDNDGHPNIVKVHDVYRDDFSCYIVMDQYVEDLYDFEASELPEERLAEMTADMVRAVQHLHSNDIIHRDIKCDNFFIADDGRVVLSDFGVSMETTCEEAGIHSEEIVGVNEYRPPEVWRDDFGKKADMWSLGVVLYKIGSGFLPFNGQDETRLRKIIEKRLCTWKALHRQTPPEFVDLVQKLLVPDPKKRLSAAEALEHPFIQHVAPREQQDQTSGDRRGRGREGGRSAAAAAGGWLLLSEDDHKEAAAAAAAVGGRADSEDDYGEAKGIRRLNCGCPCFWWVRACGRLFRRRRRGGETLMASEEGD